MNKLKSFPSIVVFTVSLGIVAMPFLVTGIASESNKLFQHIQQYQEQQQHQWLDITEV